MTADQDGGLGAAFSVVASETRFEIIEALWAETRGTESDAVGFADLRAAAGIRDSGQFNYHLDQLRPRFVRKCDEGYELTHAGTQIIGAAVSGVYTDLDATVEPQSVGACPACSATVEASYSAGEMRIECTACELTITDLSAPPILAASFDDEELPAVFSRHLLTEVQRMNRGFCPLCSGPVEVALDRKTDGKRDTLADHLDVVYTCRECGMTAHGVVALSVIGHPAVVSFCHEAGVDVRETPVWELDWLFDAPGTVTSEDPTRIETTIELDDRALTLTLDGSLDVLDHEETETTDATA